MRSWKLLFFFKDKQGSNEPDFLSNTNDNLDPFWHTKLLTNLLTNLRFVLVVVLFGYAKFQISKAKNLGTNVSGFLCNTFGVAKNQGFNQPGFSNQRYFAKNIKWSQLFTSIYFLAFLIIPIGALIVKAFSLSPDGGSFTQSSGIGNWPLNLSFFYEALNRVVAFMTIATQPIALSAYKVTFSMAAIASLFNAFFGFILAWVLVRYNFPFKRFLDLAVDLPFAVPTSVAGLTLSTVYSPQGPIGETLQKLGIQVIYTRLGVATAMVFVSLPFVVRSLQPVLQEIDEQIEEAALSLGASPYTIFRKVLFPPLLPAFLTGITLGFSRAIGEYGSLVLVSSNIPYKDLIASVLIFQKLESYSLKEATVIATVVLLISFSILLGVSLLQSWIRNKNS